MPTIIKHRKIKIIVLAEGEALQTHCSAGDIAVEPDGSGWWLRFISEGGVVDSYDQAYPSYNAALWAAKAAAEFGF